MEAVRKIVTSSTCPSEHASMFLSQYEKTRTYLKQSFNDQAQIDEALKILERTAQTACGRFLIQHSELDIYWSDLLLYNPSQLSSLAKENADEILETLPLVTALRQHIDIRRQILEDNLRNYLTISTLPCNGMGDILSINDKTLHTLRLIGIDTNPVAFEIAFQKAEQKNLSHWLEFLQYDPHHVPLEKDAAHLVIMPGSAYPFGPVIPSITQNLLTNVYQHLQEGGIFLTSLITPSPTTDAASLWDLKAINPSTLHHQNVLFKDILQIKENHTLTVDQLTDQLAESGFQNIEVGFDPAKIMATVVAQK